jgi:hypothetical protein
MQTGQCIPGSSKMISRMARVEKLLRMEACTLELLKTDIFMELEGTDSPMKGLSTKEIGLTMK